ncbi:MAG TPA: hypothetical protein VN634_03970 [Candidatus Limnocylindrales bacterium]|nr:hypothetical protein [Candidatus Limnocylindrales bacterium]
MGLDQTLGNVQAESKPAAIVFADLPEALEDGFELVLVDADSGIADREADFSALVVYAHHHAGPVGAELDRVRNEVSENLKDPLVVERGRNRAWHGCFERNPFCERLRLPGPDRVEDDIRRAALRRDDGQLSGVDTCNVDQISDEPFHARGGSLNALDRDTGVPVVLRGADFFLDPGRAQDDSGQQVAKIVAHHSEKIVAIGKLGVGACALEQKVLVGLVPLQRNQTGEDTRMDFPLPAKDEVGHVSHVLENLIFFRALVREDGLIGRARMLELLVGLGAGGGQNFIGLLARTFDERVRGTLDGGFLGKGDIRLRTFDRETLIGHCPFGLQIFFAHEATLRGIDPVPTSNGNGRIVARVRRDTRTCTESRTNRALPVQARQTDLFLFAFRVHAPASPDTTPNSDGLGPGKRRPPCPHKKTGLTQLRY